MNNLIDEHFITTVVAIGDVADVLYPDLKDIKTAKIIKFDNKFSLKEAEYLIILIDSNNRKDALYANYIISNVNASFTTIITANKDEDFEYESESLIAINDSTLNCYKNILSVTNALIELTSISGLINVDLDDLKLIIKNESEIFVGVGEAKGDNRGIIAIQKALSCNFNNTDVSNIEKAIINITAPKDISLREVDQVIKELRDECVTDPNIIYGTAISNDDKIKVFIIGSK